MPTTNPRIRALTDQFVADLSAAIHEAALEAVREALGDVPASGGTRRRRKKAGRKKAANGRRKKKATRGRKRAARQGKRVRRSAQDVDATAKAILAHVRANAGSSAIDIAEALGLTTKDLRLPIQRLLADKKLRTKGERRGTRYFAK